MDNVVGTLDVLESIRTWGIFLATIIGVIIAGAGVYFAASGLSTWRDQLHGRTEYDLARRYLRSTYKVRDALQRVRSPFMFGEEMMAALKMEGIDINSLEKNELQERGKY